jgi:hypothetical protein
MVFIEFDWRIKGAGIAAATAGPSAMADFEGRVHCWWFDDGQHISVSDPDENRLARAITNDGTGRTAEATVQGPVLDTDAQTAD